MGANLRRRMVARCSAAGLASLSADSCVMTNRRRNMDRNEQFRLVDGVVDYRTPSSFTRTSVFSQQEYRRNRISTSRDAKQPAFRRTMRLLQENMLEKDGAGDEKRPGRITKAFAWKSQQMNREMILGQIHPDMELTSRSKKCRSRSVEAQGANGTFSMVPAELMTISSRP
jgi:hypothetical protein